MWSSSSRAGMTAVTDAGPDGRFLVASDRSGRAAASPERRAGSVMRFAAHASKPMTRRTNASVVTSPAITSVSVGVEYKTSRSTRPTATSFETGVFTPPREARSMAPAMATKLLPRINPGTARTNHDDVPSSRSLPRARPYRRGTASGDGGRSVEGGAFQPAGPDGVDHATPAVVASG